jgi:hypothetical protein
MGDGVRKLLPDDAEALVALRREALNREPLAFAASPDDDRGLSPELVRSALANDREQAVFGHVEHDHFTGMVGLARLGEARVPTYRTDLDGAVTFYLDGKNVIPGLPQAEVH